MTTAQTFSQQPTPPEGGDAAAALAAANAAQADATAALAAIAAIDTGTEIAALIDAVADTNLLTDAERAAIAANTAAIAAMPALITAAAATTPAEIRLAEATNNGAHKVTVKAPDAVTADVVVRMPNANADLGDIELASLRYPPAASSFTVDGATGRSVAVRLPYDMTITGVYFVGRVMTASDINYWTFDAKFIPSTGAASTGTSLCSAPKTSQATGGDAHPALPTVADAEMSLYADQNLTRSRGDIIYAHFTATLTPDNLHNGLFGLVVKGTRR